MDRCWECNITNQSYSVNMAFNNSELYVAHGEEITASDMNANSFDNQTSYKLMVKKFNSGSWSDCQFRNNRLLHI